MPWNEQTRKRWLGCPPARSPILRGQKPGQRLPPAAAPSFPDGPSRPTAGTAERGGAAEGPSPAPRGAIPTPASRGPGRLGQGGRADAESDQAGRRPSPSRSRGVSAGSGLCRGGHARAPGHRAGRCGGSGPGVWGGSTWRPYYARARAPPRSRAGASGPGRPGRRGRQLDSAPARRRGNYSAQSPQRLTLFSFLRELAVFIVNLGDLEIQSSWVSFCIERPQLCVKPYTRH